MKSLVKSAILTVCIGFMLGSAVSCKKDSEEHTDIYALLSGVWMPAADGAPVLYLIGGEEYKIYRYTYPYPIDEAQMDAGWFEADPNGSIVFTNSLTQQQVTYTYKLTDNNNTLQLGSSTYKRSDSN